MGVIWSRLRFNPLSIEAGWQRASGGLYGGGCLSPFQSSQHRGGVAELEQVRRLTAPERFQSSQHRGGVAEWERLLAHSEEIRVSILSASRRGGRARDGDAQAPSVSRPFQSSQHRGGVAENFRMSSRASSKRSRFNPLSIEAGWQSCGVDSRNHVNAHCFNPLSIEAGWQSTQSMRTGRC